MSGLATEAISLMGGFVVDYKELWAIPIGVCALCLVLATVVGAIRNK